MKWIGDSDIKMLYAIYIAFLKNCCSHGLLRERFWPYKVARMYSVKKDVFKILQ